jgi:predicted ATP-grasp superfamily ATP-dependent carboligase
VSGARGPLVVLGASARSAAQSAARARFEPFAIDLFADRDLAALCPAVRIERYPAEFVRALAAAPEAPWIYGGGLENYPRLVARMAELRPLWGNGAPVLREVRDPWRLRSVLSEEGFAFPELWTPGSRPGRRWLLKPRRGSAGLGVRFATESDFQPAAQGTVLQEYIDGASCSATYVAARGRAVLLGATRQIVGRDWGLAPEFQYVGSLGPLSLVPRERATLARLGDVLAARFGLAGLFGVDFIRTVESLWPVEVNPRYTASVEVLERVTGRHFVADHAAACADGTLPKLSGAATAMCAGKAVVYARRACMWQGCDVTEIADVPRDGQALAAGQPVVTVFASGSSLDAVEQTLRERAAAVLGQT